MKQQEKAVIAVTIALLIIVATVIFVVAGVYTSWFSHEFKHFYVSVGRTKYLQDAEVVLGNTRFDVHHVLKKDVGYTVQVLPTGEDFTFQLDGRWLSYTSELKDVTEAFEIEQGEKSFTIRCKQKLMQDVLETVYLDSEVNIPSDDVDLSAHFKLVVTAGDDSESITLTFRCLIRMTDFEVDPPNLVI